MKRMALTIIALAFIITSAVCFNCQVSAVELDIGGCFPFIPVDGTTAHIAGRGYGYDASWNPNPLCPTHDITIPATVSNGTNTYTVVAIADSQVFMGRDLTGTLTIPATIESIWGSQFLYTKFSTLLFQGETPPTISVASLGDGVNLAEIIVPCGSADAYALALSSPISPATIPMINGNETIMEFCYTDDNTDYVRESGDRLDLSVANFWRWQAAPGVYWGGGLAFDLPSTGTSPIADNDVKWYRDGSLVATGANFTATLAGTYHAEVYGVKLGDITVTFLNNPNLEPIDPVAPNAPNAGVSSGPAVPVTFVVALIATITGAVLISKERRNRI